MFTSHPPKHRSKTVNLPTPPKEVRPEVYFLIDNRENHIIEAARVGGYTYNVVTLPHYDIIVYKVPKLGNTARACAMIERKTGGDFSSTITDPVRYHNMLCEIHRGQGCLTALLYETKHPLIPEKHASEGRFWSAIMNLGGRMFVSHDPIDSLAFLHRGCMTGMFRNLFLRYPATGRGEDSEFNMDNYLFVDFLRGEILSVPTLKYTNTFHIIEDDSEEQDDIMPKATDNEVSSNILPPARPFVGAQDSDLAQISIQFLEKALTIAYTASKSESTNSGYDTDFIFTAFCNFSSFIETSTRDDKILARFEAICSGKTAGVEDEKQASA